MLQRASLGQQVINGVFKIGITFKGFAGGSVVENPPTNAGDTGDVGLIHGSGRSPGEGSDNPLQYACLENPMDKGAWWATVPGVTKSWTRLSMHACTHTHTHTHTHTTTLKPKRSRGLKEIRIRKEPVQMP